MTPAAHRLRSVLSFVFLRSFDSPNVRLQPRWLTIAPATVGCKPCWAVLSPGFPSRRLCRRRSGRSFRRDHLHGCDDWWNPGCASPRLGVGGQGGEAAAGNLRRLTRPRRIHSDPLLRTSGPPNSACTRRRANPKRQRAAGDAQTFGESEERRKTKDKTDRSRCAAGVMGGPWRTLRPAVGRCSGGRRIKNDHRPRRWCRRRGRRPGELWSRRMGAAVTTEEPGTNPEQGALPDRRR